MQSIGQRVRDLSTELSKPTNSDVVHLRTLRAAIGFLGLGLPLTLALGENIRDRYLSAGAEAGRWYIEGSISAYYHTGMREVFVAILAALGIFLLCYKGPERWDVIAAKLAGAAAILVAILPTHEKSREATDTGGRLPDSVTLFSGPDVPDPEIIGTLHYVSAAVFFVTVALMALFLFTRTGSAVPTGRKRLRNLVYRVSGLMILVAIAAIAVDKLLLGSRWSGGTSFVFWMETVAVTAFGVAWLTKAEVLLKDRANEVPAAVGVAGGALPSALERREEKAER
jgi:hypothetical protein